MVDNQLYNPINNKISTSCDNLLEQNLISQKAYRNCQNIVNKYSLDINLDDEIRKYTGNKGEINKMQHQKFLDKVKKRFDSYINNLIHHSKLSISNQSDTRNLNKVKEVKINLDRVLEDMRKYIKHLDSLPNNESQQQYYDLISKYKIIERNRDQLLKLDSTTLESKEKYKINKNRHQDLHNKIYLNIFWLIIFVFFIVFILKKKI